jgi:hypothetical protein
MTYALARGNEVREASEYESECLEYRSIGVMGF